MRTIDLKKTLKPYYTASAAKPAILNIPPLATLRIDGRGDPNGPDFQAAVSSLYSVAYTLKFTFKKEKAVDYPVMALEGLWWADDPEFFMTGDRDKWHWTAFIVTPDIVTKEDVAAAMDAARKKGRIPDLREVRLETFAEGRAAQVMHIGPYAAEGPTIDRLFKFIAGEGYKLRGRHHEIYMGDPRRSAPEKLKTILRHPIAKA